MRKLLGFTIGFVLACLGAVYLFSGAWALWLGLGSLAGFGLLRTLRRGSGDRRKVLRYFQLGLLGLGVGLLWCRAYDGLRLSPARAMAGTWEELTAEVCAYPVPVAYGLRTEVLIPGEGGAVKAQVYFSETDRTLEPGDRITGAFALQRGDRTRRGEERLDLQAKGILLTGSVKIRTVTPGDRPLGYLPQRAAHRLGKAIDRLFPGDVAGFYKAILTGDRTGLDQASRDRLTGAGASHVIAVSGLHVSLLLGILMAVLGRGRLSSVLGILLLAFFALMTGASPSVVRAAFTLSVLLLAPLVGEENDPPTALAAAALALLAWNPWTAANVSFQLSFGAVAGLLLVTRPLQTWLEALPPAASILNRKPVGKPGVWGREGLLRLLRYLLRFLLGSGAATCGALVFTLPISAWTFGSTATYSLLTNLFVLPLTGLCLGGSLAVLGLGLILPAGGAWLGWLRAWPARGIFWICGLVSRLPGAQLYVDGRYGTGFLVFFCLAVALAFLLRTKNFGWLLGAVALGLTVSVGLQTLEARSGRLTLAALDVGQGQCVCILDQGFGAMVDCGGASEEYTGSLAARYLRRKGVAALDALILTHYDRDHCAGVPSLLEQIPVARIYLPEVEFDPEARAKGSSKVTAKIRL